MDKVNEWIEGQEMDDRCLDCPYRELESERICSGCVRRLAWDTLEED